MADRPRKTGGPHCLRAQGPCVTLGKSLAQRGLLMATITKKELIDQIAEKEHCKRVLVKRLVQAFLDAIVEELGNGNRLEFRDFGVFESKLRGPREAQNPKTMDKVPVPSRRTVKFKVGRSMKNRLRDAPTAIDEATGLAIESSAQHIANKT